MAVSAEHVLYLAAGIFGAAPTRALTYDLMTRKDTVALANELGVSQYAKDVFGVSNQAKAEKLADNLLGTSVTDTVKTAAIGALKSMLDANGGNVGAAGYEAIVFLSKKTDASYADAWTQLQNRVAVAQAYVDSANPATTFPLTSVTKDTATKDAVIAAIKAGADTAPLTVNSDLLVANKFSAGLDYTPGGNDRVNTLQDEDVLTGVGVNPTLNATLGNANDNGATTIHPTLRGVETINVAFSGAGNAVTTLDLQDATGVKAVNITRVSQANGNAVVENLQTVPTTLSVNSSNVQTARVEFSFLASAVAGATDSTELTLNSANINNLVVEQNMAAGVLANNGATEGVETINLVSSGSANTVGVLQAEDLQTLNISGKQNLTLGNNTGAVVRAGTTTSEANTFAAALANVAGSLTKIDASTLEGNLSINLGAELNAGLDNTSGKAVQMQVLGGKGNDTFVLTQGANIDATATNTDKIDGGEGTNKLVLLGGVAQTVAAAGTAAAPVANLTKIQALEVRTGHDDAGVVGGLGIAEVADVVTVNADAFDALATIYVRNEGQGSAAVGVAATGTNVSKSEVMTVNLNNLTAAQATAITVAHGTTGNSTIDNNNLAVAFKTAGTANAAQVTLVDGVNNDPVFNLDLTVTSGELVTIVDTDTESNSVYLNQGTFTQAGSTITLKTGTAGQYMNLDVTNNGAGGAAVAVGGADGYGYATDGSAGSNTTAVAAAAAIAGVPTTTSTSQRDGAVASVLYGTTGVAGDNATRHAIENIVANEYVGDVIVRLGDVTRADGVSSMNIKTGTGNDTFIFDQLGATNAGFTSGDTIAAGTGTDTLVIDGNTATIPGTPRINHQTSEWDNLTGIDVLRFGNNAGVANVGNGAQVANAGGAYYAQIDNDFITQTDAGNRLTVVNNDGDLNLNTESDLVLDLRGLNQNKWITFVGANGVGNAAISSNRIVVSDISANQNMILNGGDTDVRAATTGGYVARNNNVYEVRNTADVSINDLAQTSNFGLINFTNDQAVAQTLTLTLNNTVVEALVDSSNTATSAATQEILNIVANDNGAVASVLNVNAGAVTGFLALNVTGSVAGNDVITLNSNVGGSTSTVNLSNTSTGDRVNWVGDAANTVVTIDMGADGNAGGTGAGNGFATFQLGAVTTTHDMDNVDIVDLTSLTYATSTVASLAGKTVIGAAASVDTVNINAAVLTGVATAAAILTEATTITGFTGLAAATGDVIKLGAAEGATVNAVATTFAAAADIAAVTAAFANAVGAVDIAYINQGAGGNVYVFVDLNASDMLNAGDAVVVLTGVGTGVAGSAIAWDAGDIIA